MTVRERNGKNERRLSIIKDTLEVVPDFNLNITELNRGKDGTKYKHFFNNGYGGLTFKCQVVIHRGRDKNHDNVKLLHNWYIDSTPLIVATDAIDIFHGQNNTKWDAGLFIITKNSSRKQTSENYTVWDLEFTSYTPLTVYKFKNDNSSVLKALNKATSDKNKSSEANKIKQAVALTALQVSFSLCSLSQLKYSKKKKTNECVKKLQQLLQKYKYYLNNKVDGWYGKDTMNAVKKYQKAVGLKSTGKIDKTTMKYLVNGITWNQSYVKYAGKVASKVSKTIK